MGLPKLDIGFFDSIGFVIDAVERRDLERVIIVDSGIEQPVPSVKDSALPSTANRRGAVVGMLNMVLEDVYQQDFTSPSSEFGFRVIPWKGEAHVYLFVPEGQRLHTQAMRQILENYKGLLKSRVPPHGTVQNFDPDNQIVIGPQRHEAFVYVDGVMHHAMNFAYDMDLPLDSTRFLDMGVIQKPYRNLDDEYGFYVCDRNAYLALFQNETRFDPFAAKDPQDDHPLGGGPVN